MIFGQMIQASTIGPHDAQLDLSQRSLGTYTSYHPPNSSVFCPFTTSISAKSSPIATGISIAISIVIASCSLLPLFVQQYK